MRSLRCHLWTPSEILVSILLVVRVEPVVLGRGNVHQYGGKILDRFTSQDAQMRSCLGRIRTGEKCYIKPLLIYGERSLLNCYGLETQGICKWDPPPSEEAFFIPGRGVVFLLTSFC